MNNQGNQEMCPFECTGGEEEEKGGKEEERYREREGKEGNVILEFIKRFVRTIGEHARPNQG